MSRTFRRRRTTKNGMWSDLEYYVSTWVYPYADDSIWSYPRYREQVFFEKNSKEYRKGKAIFHSDAATTSFKEPGPSRFRRLYNTKPSRCGARNEINKWLRNEEYEVVLETHPHLPYWT